MSKFNLDEDKTLSGPIEFVIDGKTFKVEKIPDYILKKVDEVERASDQFALFVGIDPKEAQELDIRKIFKANSLILETITKAKFEGVIGTLKNLPKATTVKNRKRPGKKK